MKIRQRTLKRIIREEVQSALNEGEYDPKCKMADGTTQYCPKYVGIKETGNRNFFLSGPKQCYDAEWNEMPGVIKCGMLQACEGGCRMWRLKTPEAWGAMFARAPAPQGKCEGGACFKLIGVTK